MSEQSATALVTGAGSGLGRAVALALAVEGHRLALVDIDGASVEAVAAESLARGAPDAVAFAAEVSSEDDVARCVGRVARELGPPAATFANAGIEINGPAHELALSTWQQVIGVNLTGVFLTTKHVLGALLEAGVGGSIVCTGSPSAFCGFAGGGNAAYGASKGGIVALVKSLAVDYAAYGIRVNAVIPGAIDTPHLGVGVPTDERGAHLDELRRRAAAQIPLGRLGRPDEVAEAVTWLLSSRSSYVTGSTLVCDGGVTARSANDF